MNLNSPTATFIVNLVLKIIGVIIRIRCWCRFLRNDKKRSYSQADCGDSEGLSPRCKTGVTKASS
jgi:hypothetical protein